jgi:xanthine dehydrogenase accessory factor
MTHDHALDYELCRRALERGTLGWLGLIGSKSKGARFRSRFARDGIRAEQIAHLTCPIGIEGVTSKLPAAIAVAVAAQLLRGVGTPPSRGAAPAVAPPDAICTSADCQSCAARQAAGKWAVDP